MSVSVRDQVSGLPFVRWVGPFHPAHRVSEELVDEFTADVGLLQTRRCSIMTGERGQTTLNGVSDRVAALCGVGWSAGNHCYPVDCSTY